MTADLTTRVRTDLPASKPPVKPEQPVKRQPHKASTASRDPFEVMGIKPDAEDDIPF